MRREDLEYWNTVLGETYESDGFYTDRPRVTPLRERTQTYIDLGTGGGDFASDGKWPFAVSFAAAVSFVMSKNLMKNDVMIGLSAGKENQKGAALTGYVANLSADMQVAELKRQIAARREEALNHSETFSEALEHFEMKGNEYVPRRYLSNEKIKENHQIYQTLSVVQSADTDNDPGFCNYNTNRLLK